MYTALKKKDLEAQSLVIPTRKNKKRVINIDLKIIILDERIR